MSAVYKDFGTWVLSRVQSQVNDKPGDAVHPGVAGLEGTLGHLGPGMDHPVVDRGRRGVRDHKIGVDPVAVGSFDTGHPPVLDQDPFHASVVLNVAAQLPDPGVQGRGKLVGAMSGDPGIGGEEFVEHGPENGEIGPA